MSSSLGRWECVKIYVDKRIRIGAIMGRGKTRPAFNKVGIMSKSSYDEILRKSLGGNKFLSTGEINPNYNPKWGLEKGRILSMARSYAKSQSLFIEGSKTEKPIEFIATGIAQEKAQYQFRQLEKDIKGYTSETDARTRAVDVSRLENLINSTINARPVEYSYDENGIAVHETIYSPAYYAELYLEGKITREQFFRYIYIWEHNSNEYLYKAYDGK